MFLAGPPGAGKSTAAIAVGDRLGLEVVDLDDLIATRTGRTPAELIRTVGEEAFRAEELAALRALPEVAQVVALGGGTITRPDARTEVRRRGIVVGLDIDPQVLSDRLTAQMGSTSNQVARNGRGDRPLLKDASVDAVRALLEARAHAYATVDRTVDANAPIEVVADAVVRAVNDMHVVRATVGAQRSRILIGRDLVGCLQASVANLAPTRPLVVITDGGIPEATRQRWLEPLEAFVPVVRIDGPGGEAMKSWTMLGRVLETALAGGAGRQSVVVGIGGGATCDLAAMVAALLARGAPLVLVPSSLLAQVDASVGGKAAVNADTGRNLIGVFHAARDVLVDPNLLESLPAQEHRSGLAELFKMAALYDASLLDQVVAGTPITPQILTRAVELKAEVVARDPHERNERKQLNFGHTLAHGIEAASNYSWPHGYAVAAGMAAIARWSAAEQWMSEQACQRLLHGLAQIGLPVGVPTNLLDKAVDFLGHDKKATGAKITVVTLQALAEPAFREISLETVRRAMIQHGGEQ